MSKTKTVEQLADTAWDLINQALTQGTIQLEGEADPRPLETEQLIDMAMKLSAVKIKKPQIVTTPEGFKLKDTTGGKDDDETV